MSKANGCTRNRMGEPLFPRDLEFWSYQKGEFVARQNLKYLSGISTAAAITIDMQPFVSLEQPNVRSAPRSMTRGRSSLYYGDAMSHSTNYRLRYPKRKNSAHSLLARVISSSWEKFLREHSQQKSNHHYAKKICLDIFHFRWNVDCGSGISQVCDVGGLELQEAFVNDISFTLSILLLICIKRVHVVTAIITTFQLKVRSR